MDPPMNPYINVPMHTNFSYFDNVLYSNTFRKPIIGNIKVINVPVKAP